jgi:hypothetical protein
MNSKWVFGNVDIRRQIMDELKTLAENETILNKVDLLRQMLEVAKQDEDLKGFIPTLIDIPSVLITFRSGVQEKIVTVTRDFLGEIVIDDTFDVGWKPSALSADVSEVNDTEIEEVEDVGDLL